MGLEQDRLVKRLVAEGLDSVAGDISGGFVSVVGGTGVSEV